MDSKARLDYALFQLTPTRTRCDLVVFSRGVTEKLASGLFEPFISHLKSAKDQIFKGGYSIKLHPPTNGSPWFTKGTFERFVRFVSTPAVLERFVSLEREILQIESSVQANELLNTNVVGRLVEVSAANGRTRKSADSSKLKGELEGIDDDTKEENSKVHLQRLLDARKMLLRKEQAMAYARGIVAGFEMDNIDDLISFADAFGALRLREACINFKELCKKKHADGLWMEELAAMEACSPSELSLLGTSGIVLMNEISANNQNATLDSSKGGSIGSLDCKKDDNSPASDQIPSTNAKVQLPMPWPNQIPQYMYNFQIPIQQMPPYQGYPLPTVQSVPPHYPKNMQWPPNMDKSSHSLVQKPNYQRNQKSYLRKKEKYSNKKESGYAGEDRQTESSDSDSGSASDSHSQKDRKHSSMGHSYIKKHRKKSSRTVVIRNINYITPDGDKSGVSDGSTPDEEFINGDSLKQEVEDAVGSLEKFHKSNTHNYKKRGLVTDASEEGGRNENCGPFENLLTKDNEMVISGVEKLHHMDIQDEHFTVRSSEGGNTSFSRSADALEFEKAPKQLTAAADSFVVTERKGENEGRLESEDFINGEEFHPVIKRRDCADEEFLFSQRLEESGTGLGVLSACAAESISIKTGRTEDWFVVNHSGISENQDVIIKQTVLNGDCILSVEGDCSQTGKSGTGTFIDDSFMIETRLEVDGMYDFQWKTDISMENDINVAASAENGISDISKVKHDVSNACEPDDLCVVFERDSRLESAEVSWSMDYGIDILVTEANGRCSGVETSDLVDKNLSPNCNSANVNNNEVPGRKNPGKEARSKGLRGSIGKSKSDSMCKSIKPSSLSRPIVQKSKLEKEEETRKKMEELLIQRQKRIAERTAASGGFAPAASKKVPSESKTVHHSFKSDNSKIHSMTRETNRIGFVKIRQT